MSLTFRASITHIEMKVSRKGTGFAYCKLSSSHFYSFTGQGQSRYDLAKHFLLFGLSEKEILSRSPLNLLELAKTLHLPLTFSIRVHRPSADAFYPAITLKSPPNAPTFTNELTYPW